MSRWLVIILMGLSFGIGVGAGVLGLLWATGGNSEPSQDIVQVVPTLSLNTVIPPANFSQDFQQLNGRLDTLSTQVAALSIPAPVVQATPIAEVLPTGTPTPAPENTPTEIAAAVPARALFRISQEQSEARFLIDEVLSGNPITVVGRTQQVAGDIIIDYANPAASTVGQIGVNARTFATDSELRNQAIRGRILESSRAEYEFITFTPVELIGLPTTSINVGDVVNFQIRGDLLIRGITQNVTFNVTLNALSETQISGLASTTVRYDDFGLVINGPPSVTNIGDTVTLEFEFVANQVGQAS